MGSRAIALSPMKQVMSMSDGRTESCGVAPMEIHPMQREISEVELDHAIHPQDELKLSAGGAGELVDAEPDPNDFQKWDSDKTSFMGMPQWIWWEMLNVSQFGAQRYGQRNWQKCTDVSRYVDALYRHLLAVVMGQEIDPDSTLPHLAHAMWNLAALRWFQKNKPELMDGLGDFL